MISSAYPPHHVTKPATSSAATPASFLGAKVILVTHVALTPEFARSSAVTDWIPNHFAQG